MNLCFLICFEMCAQAKTQLDYWSFRQYIDPRRKTAKIYWCEWEKLCGTSSLPKKTWSMYKEISWQWGDTTGKRSKSLPQGLSRTKIMEGSYSPPWERHAKTLNVDPKTIKKLLSPWDFGLKFFFQAATTSHQEHKAKKRFDRCKKILSFLKTQTTGTIKVFSNKKNIHCGTKFYNRKEWTNDLHQCGPNYGWEFCAARRNNFCTSSSNFFFFEETLWFLGRKRKLHRSIPVEDLFFFF